jgi:integrase/recombinase XerD
MSSFPCLVRFVSGSGQVRYRLGDRLAGRYLEFVAGRCRPDTLRAVAFDLKAFFTVTGKDPVPVTAADVFEFLAHQRGDRAVVRLADRESGLSARTIARRLSSVSGLYAYLAARGDTPVQVNPVPRGLPTRRERSRPGQGVPLVRAGRRLPRIFSPAEVDALMAALRTHRDRAMVLAMLLAGLRRCEVLGLRFADVQVADRRLAVVEGKGGHHRVVPAELATELPVAILARMLGIHIDVAVAWQRASAGDWMTYAADVSRRPGTTGSGITREDT